MKFVDEFRSPAAAQRLLAEIHAAASRPWTLMEVCGGQTHGLLRHGIDRALEGTVELLHGPGCPVCVTPPEAIDLACRLAVREATTVFSFGDMLRVPGSDGSLLAARRQGGDVRIAYSPLDALAHAAERPEQTVVFFAVGFETTAPATALALLQAERRGLANFYLLVAHVRVQPAMEAILSAADRRVQAFLAAGHVCAVLGVQACDQLADRFGVPIVATGFEPLDLLSGILAAVRLLEAGQVRAVNAYSRCVLAEGNRLAQDHLARVFEPCDLAWRGLGSLAAGGLALRPEWARFDARRLVATPIPVVAADRECRAGDVLCGRIRPPDCPAFGGRCTPEHPLGAPMVSSEGACAAYFRYRPEPQIHALPANPR